MLRIIGGLFKSRLIKTPKSLKTRPTSSLVRKAFFDICREEIGGCQFLDLYAGSGAIGIEAISRGANHTTFVETSKEAVHCIKENLKLLGIENQGSIIVKEALLALNMLKKSDTLYDLIYIDPPYEEDPLPILQFLDHNPLLVERGMLFLEERSPSKVQVEKNHFKQLKWVKERKFGMTVLNQFILSINKDGYGQGTVFRDI